MPSRIIREGILTSLKVNQLSVDAELFYRRMLNVVDDFGRYHGTPSLIRAAAYPLRIDTIKDKDVDRWIAQCAQAGLLLHYKSAGVPYIQIVNFGTPRAKESKFPQPQTDENNCLQMIADALPHENNGTVVVSVVEDVSVSGGGGHDIPDDLRGLELYEADKVLCKAWPATKRAIQQAYPHVDVLGEVRRAHAWEVGQPTKKKLRAKFLTSWCSRAEPPAPSSGNHYDIIDGVRQ